MYFVNGYLQKELKGISLAGHVWVFFLVVVTLSERRDDKIGFSRAERLRRDGEDNNGHSLPPSAEILQVANDAFFFLFYDYG